MEVLKNHIIIKQQHHASYNNLKENSKQGVILLYVEYRENSVSKQQVQIQSPYFGHDTVSIFTVCSYLGDADRKMINENVTIISEASDQSRTAAFSFGNKVFNTFLGKHNNLPLKVTLHVRNDGCAGKF